MSGNIDRFKNSEEYQNYVKRTTDEIFKEREKVSKREVFTIFSDKIDKLNSQGLKRLNEICAIDNDGTTINKDEMMMIYSLLDLDISKSLPDGNIDSENSVLNLASDEEFRRVKDSLIKLYQKQKSEPDVHKNQKSDNDMLLKDSAKIVKNFETDIPEFNAADYTIDALKKRFPEPEYQVYEEQSYITGLPPATIIKKDGKEVARVVDFSQDEVVVSLSKYDDHGNLTLRTFLRNGQAYRTEETKYQYDKNGNIVSERRYEDGKMKGGSYKEYDDNNSVTYEAMLDGNGKPYSIRETKYKYINEYYVKKENGELETVFESDIVDTQEELEYRRSVGTTAYLKSDIDSVYHHPMVDTEILRDANGNVIEEYQSWDIDENGNERPEIKKHSPLADEIYAAICAKTSLGIPTTDMDGLKIAMAKVDNSNIQNIMYYFKTTYGTDLLTAIKQEWGARISNNSEMNAIIDRLKTLIAESGSYEQTNEYLLEAMSGIPDMDFIEKIMMNKNFSPIITNDYFLEHTGKSFIQFIMDKNLTMSLENREKLIRHIIDRSIGTPEDYNNNVRFDMDGLRKQAYDELNTQLNKIGTMDASRLEQILQSKGFNTGYKDPNLPNGKIDKMFSQGYAGDCWLIAPIMAIALTSNADKYFSKILSTDDLGNVSVNLNGAEKPYTITKQDIAYGGFLKGASGDGDVKAIEQAVEKRLVELGRTKKEALDGGTIYDAFILLVGQENLKCYNLSELTPDFIKEKFNYKNNAAILGRYDSEHVINKAFNSKGEPVELLSKHGFAVSRVDNNYVYFIDPNIGKEEYHISIEDLSKAFDTCAIATLD